MLVFVFLNFAFGATPHSQIFVLVHIKHRDRTFVVFESIFFAVFAPPQLTFCNFLKKKTKCWVTLFTVSPATHKRGQQRRRRHVGVSVYRRAAPHPSSDSP